MATSKHETAILEKEKEILKEEKKIELETEKLFSLSSYMRKLLRKDLQHEERERNNICAEICYQ